MKNNIFLILTFFFTNFIFSQTKVSGIVVDKANQPIPYANVVFKNSNIGIVTNEDGRFYIESEKKYTTLIVSFVGFEDKEVELTKAINYNFRIQLPGGLDVNDIHPFLFRSTASMT